MNDNPLRDIHCREFEQDLRTSRSVAEAIQSHRKHIKRLWRTLFGLIGMLVILMLVALVFGQLNIEVIQFPLFILLISAVSMIGHTARLESGLKVLLLRKVLLDEAQRKAPIK